MDRPLVLVTGGAGFIGGHLFRLLVEQEYRVRILDHLGRADPPVVDQIRACPDVELIESDVRYRGSVDRAMKSGPVGGPADPRGAAAG